MATAHRIKTGGPAFPTVKADSPGEAPVGTYVTTCDESGMTLRDYFAAAAMQALIAKIPLHDTEGEHGISATDEQARRVRADVAESAYGYAHYMVLERDEPHVEPEPEAVSPLKALSLAREIAVSEQDFPAAAAIRDLQDRMRKEGKS